MRTRLPVRFSLAVCVGVLAACAANLDAAPKPTPAATPAGTAHIRVWKTDLHGVTAARVSFMPEGRRATAHELGAGGGGYSFGEYVDLPAGRGVFGVFNGQEKNALESLPANLKPDSFATVLLTDPDKAGDPPRMELIDDGGAEPSAVAQITLRNFVPELKDVRVVLGDSLSAQFVPGRGVLLMRGIAPAVYQVRTSGVDEKGEPFQWVNEVDLRQSSRQTLLIYPDPYGRIRPRVSFDGSTPAAAPEKKDAQR